MRERTIWRRRSAAAMFLLLLTAVSIQCEHGGDSSNRHDTNESVNKDQMRSDFGEDGVAQLGYIAPGSTHEIVYILNAPADQPYTDTSLNSARISSKTGRRSQQHLGMGDIGAQA